MDEDLEKAKNTENYRADDAEEQSTAKDDGGDLFYWRSTGQHIVHFILYTLDWNSLGVLHYEDGAKLIEFDPNIIHYLVMMIICGGPLVFLHTFIGQYSQSGFFAFGSMLPLAYGLGFVMIIFSFLKLTFQIYYACFLLCYFFTALHNTKVPWIHCYDTFSYPIDCFSKKDFDLCSTSAFSNKSCFKPGTKIFAAVYFMRFLGLDGGRPIKYLEVLRMSPHMAVFYGMFHGFMVFVILVIMSTRPFRNLDATMRIAFYLCISGSLILLLVGLTRPGSFYYLLLQFPSVLSIEAFTDLDTWSATFRRTIEGLKIAEGGIIMFGSLMPSSDLSPYRSCKLSTAFLLTALVVRIHVKIFENLMLFKIGLSMEQLDLRSEESVVFVLYPVILGLQAYGHLFCFIFFFIMLLVNFCSMALRVLVMERALAFQFNILSHYPYTRFFICLGSFLASFAILIPLNSDQIYNLLGHLKKFMIVTVGLQMVVVHLYGLQRLCDDIQFYHRQTVANFMKLCWILVPIFCLGELREEFIFETEESHDTLITILTACTLIFPLTTGFLYKAVVLAKKKNLIGLLRPLDKFGPRDINLRINRLLYNPRLSEKFVASECDHVCLNQSDALEMAFQEEITLIVRLIDELEKSGEVSSEAKNLVIIAHLKKHLEILKKRPKW